MMVRSESWSHIRPYWPLLDSYYEKYSCDLKGMQTRFNSLQTIIMLNWFNINAHIILKIW